jgi:hypothetical protein
MSDTAQVAQLISRIRPILAGWPPQTQGAVLADLLATWLAMSDTTDAAKLAAAQIIRLVKLHAASEIDLLAMSVAVIREAHGILNYGEVAV